MVDTTKKKTVLTIPSKGTRIKGALALAGFSIVAWIVSLIMIKSGWINVAEGSYMLWGADLMKWGVSTAFFIYAGSETGIKMGEAYMNRGILSNTTTNNSSIDGTDY